MGDMSERRTRAEFLAHAKSVRLHIAQNPGIDKHGLRQAIPDFEYSLNYLKKIGMVRCEGNPLRAESKWFVIRK